MLRWKYMKRKFTEIQEYCEYGVGLIPDHNKASCNLFEDDMSCLQFVKYNICEAQ